LSRPFSPRTFASSASFVRVNGKIRAREVRVIGIDGKQMGVISLSDALNLARASGVDLVEIAPTAVPPVCRVVDYGKYRYEQAKKEKESKKHQHASTVKEVQLSPRIDPHDLGVKTDHAIDFDWNSAAPVPGVTQDHFGVRWTGFITPLAPGKQEFSMRLAHCYPCGDREHFVVKIDGKDVSTHSTAGAESRESTTPRFSCTNSLAFTN